MTTKTTKFLAAALLGISMLWQVQAFTCYVSVGEKVQLENSVCTNATMIFGEATEEELRPMPPFSAQFGVKDVYLVNPESIDATTTTELGDMARLGTDIRKSSDNEKPWVIKSGTDVRLYFNAGDQKLFYRLDGKDKKGDADAKTGSVTAADAISLKVGYTLTLAKSDLKEATAPEVKGDDTIAYKPIKKDESGAIKGEEHKVEIPAAVEKLQISLVGGNVTIYVTNGTNYWPEGGQKDAPEGKPAAGKWDWICTFSLDGYEFESFENGILTLVKKTNATRADSADLALTMEAASTSLKGLTTTVSDVTKEGTTDVIAAVISIIQKFGTLDFDGNGVVNFDDATFFYNFAGFFCESWVDASMIMGYTTPEATLTDAENALKFMRENLAELCFDGKEMNISNLIDNATFLYNFAGFGFGSFVDPIMVTSYTSPNATENDAKNALENMREIYDSEK